MTPGGATFRLTSENCFLSPEVEDMAETKRWHSDLHVSRFKRLQDIQQSILTLIDAELAERGLGGEE